MNKREDFKQLVRYGVVGVANTLLTFVSYWISDTSLAMLTLPTA